MKKEKTAKARDESLKEAEIRALIQVLQEGGVEIRREKLRSGSGWRVLSGSCRLAAKQLLFVDRKLSADEQLEILREAAHSLGVRPLTLSKPDTIDSETSAAGA